jgi:hypothetical protein
MPDLYLCAHCKMPFIAEDKGRVARRDGYCADCTKVKFLEMLGLPADFLSRRLGPT